jgi:hypothetical protein
MVSCSPAPRTDSLSENSDADLKNEVGLSILRSMSAPPSVSENRSISPPIQCPEGDTRTWFEYGTSGLINSTNPKDFSWKIIRYQAILKQLKEQCSPMGELLLNLDAQEPITLQLNELYKTLMEVDLSQDDPTTFNRDYLNLLRKTYTENFIIKLRAIVLNLNDIPSEELKNTILALCQYLFTRIDLYQQSLDLVRDFDAWGANYLHRPSVTKSIHSNNKQIDYYLHALHEHFNKVPLSAKRPLVSSLGSSFKGVTSHGFDPLTESNLPHVLGQLEFTSGQGPGSKISILGFGSPTIQEIYTVKEFGEAICEVVSVTVKKCWQIIYPGSAQTVETPKVPLSENAKKATSICPLFKGWLENYKNTGTSHLFVLNQDLRAGSTRIEGDERARIQTILETAELESLKETLFVVVISKNSEFFSQKLPDDKENCYSRSQAFKKALFDQFFTVDSSISGNLIPSKIKKKIPDLKKICRTMIDTIHELIFACKENLTIEERKVFIDLFHDLLVCQLMTRLGISSINITCKDAIDRAAESTARLFYHLMLVSNQEESPELVEKFITILTVRAIMVRKRAIDDKRFERCVNTIRFYRSVKEKKQTLWKEIFGDVKLVPLNQAIE